VSKPCDSWLRACVRARARTRALARACARARLRQLAYPEHAEYWHERDLRAVQRPVAGSTLSRLESAARFDLAVPKSTSSIGRLVTHEGLPLMSRHEPW